jgi:hypothetical protein
MLVAVKSKTGMNMQVSSGRSSAESGLLSSRKFGVGGEKRHEDQLDCLLFVLASFGKRRLKMESERAEKIMAVQKGGNNVWASAPSEPVERVIDPDECRLGMLVHKS